MPYLNEHTVMGHLGSDPEIKYLASGNAVCNFSIATSERWKDKQTGDKKERTEWHRIVVWGKSAEWAGANLKKGDLVLVKAPSRTREWEDKEGVKRYTTEIVCTQFDHLKGLKYTPAEQAPAQQAQQPQKQEEFDDDIPF